ncbi:MAG: hypothetical protein A3H91_02955 [Gammaproteobacteria bacterium RIFCSPLOWO2_02_FULL_61_13]|nr:MAG: hypothetical protein A3H91_02955 [Gammaproteobacteria bacterium RIFCSPLOWO2_02_FULL_61_13]
MSTGAQSITLPARNAERDCILAARLFDADFYADAYREMLQPGEDALSHYLRAGDGLGLLPAPWFDPIRYRLERPGAVHGNAFAHALGSGSGRVRTVAQRLRAWGAALLWRCQRLRGRLFARKGMPQTGPLLRMFPRIRIRQPEIELLRYPELVEGNRRQAQNYAAPNQTQFTVDGRQYRIASPAPAFFLDRIRENRPFAFPRLPQGFWDSLAFINDVQGDMLKAMPSLPCTDAERRRLAFRLCKELQPWNGAFEENVTDEVVACIAWHKDRPDYFRAASFKGFPTFDERPFYYANQGTVHQERMQLLAQNFTADELLLDATLWKRWLISGALRELPALCRPHPVVMLGPQAVRAVPAAWELHSCNFLEIAPENTQRHRHVVLQRLQTALAGARRAAQNDARGLHPIVLMQCGGSLAYWLIARLYRDYPEAFYLDLGQVFNAWCYHVPENTERAWNYLYLRRVIDNMGLADYYRGLMGADFEQLLRRFA